MASAAEPRSARVATGLLLRRKELRTSVADFHEPALSRKRPRAAERQVAGGSVELDALKRHGLGKHLRDREGVEPKRIEAVQHRVAVVGMRYVAQAGTGGVGEPGNLDVAHAIEIVRNRH